MIDKFNDDRFKLLKSYLKQTQNRDKTVIYVAKDKVTNKYRSTGIGSNGFSETIIECLSSGSFNLYASIIVAQANKADKLHNIKDVHLYEACPIKLVDAAKLAKLL